MIIKIYHTVEVVFGASGAAPPPKLKAGFDAAGALFPLPPKLNPLDDCVGFEAPNVF